MSDTCPTVLIKSTSRSGCVEINESDFDAEKHELFNADIQDDKPDAEPVDDTISDDQLRTAIETATGKKPHWKASHETLLEQFNTINGV